jgi:hypothetical protein
MLDTPIYKIINHRRFGNSVATSQIWKLCCNIPDLETLLQHRKSRAVQSSPFYPPIASGRLPVNVDEGGDPDANASDMAWCLPQALEIPTRCLIRGPVGDWEQGCSRGGYRTGGGIRLPRGLARMHPKLVCQSRMRSRTYARFRVAANPRRPPSEGEWELPPWQPSGDI